MRTNECVFIDYAKQPEFQFHEILRGGPGYLQGQLDQLLGSRRKQICALDLTHTKTYCADYSASQQLVYGDIDFTLIPGQIARPGSATSC